MAPDQGCHVIPLKESTALVVSCHVADPDVILAVDIEEDDSIVRTRGRGAGRHDSADEEERKCERRFQVLIRFGVHDDSIQEVLRVPTP